MKKLLLSFSLMLTYSFLIAQGTEPFFSEYLEGTSNNKAVEVYNPTGTSIDLTLYKIYRYNNGSPTAQDSLAMQGTLAPGDVYVAGNPSAAPAILSVSDTLHTITFFNGDDVLELKNISTGTTLDIIGIIGMDPGTNWPVGTGATSEFTLVRMTTISAGTTNWTTGATQWDVYAQNTFTFLGNHTMNPLSLKLVSFTGQIKQNSVLLQWKVEEQENIEGFEVLKSTNGISFTTVNTIAANKNRNFTYNFTDLNITDATVFYKLKIKELQGHSFSSVIRLKINSLTEFSLLSTISKNSISIQGNDNRLLNSNATILSATGQAIIQVQIKQLPQIIDISKLSSGMYFLNIKKAEINQTVKFIKE